MIKTARKGVLELTTPDFMGFFSHQKPSATWVKPSPQTTPQQYNQTEKIPECNAPQI
jgi:hypothetical protein